MTEWSNKNNNNNNSTKIFKDAAEMSSNKVSIHMPSANQKGNIYPELLSSRNMPPPIERGYVNPGPVQFPYDFVSNMLTSSKRPPFEKLREVGMLCAELQRIAASRKGLAGTVMEALHAAIALLQSATMVSSQKHHDPFFGNQRKSIVLDVRSQSCASAILDAAAAAMAAAASAAAAKETVPGGVESQF